MKIHSKNFEEILLNWFNKNKRDLSFRDTNDPYKIWISEIMAQQTQITTMLPYYNRFIKEFPTFSSLAKADEEKVLELWEGLGYYSRAKNLKKSAQLIQKLGSFPSDYETLIKLPGIGPYTAGAILSIAFNQRIPALDGNALRVFSRIYGIKKSIDLTSTKKEIYELIQSHLNKLNNPGDFNQAIMELGAILCLKQKSKCKECPVGHFCKAYKTNSVELLPIKTKKIKKEIEYFDVLIPIKDNHPLFIKRTNEGILNNLYGFPMAKRSKNSKSIDEIIKYFKVDQIKYLGQSKHFFTHKIWNSNVYSGEVKININELVESPSMVPTAFKKMLFLMEN